MASEASYLYILSGEKLIKNAKNSQFGEKLVENDKKENSNATFLMIFKHSVLTRKFKYF